MLKKWIIIVENCPTEVDIEPLRKFFTKFLFILK